MNEDSFYHQWMFSQLKTQSYILILTNELDEKKSIFFLRKLKVSPRSINFFNNKKGFSNKCVLFSSMQLSQNMYLDIY